MSRVNNLQITLEEAMLAVSGANLGAMSALQQLVNTAEKIDPDNALGSFGTIMTLDDCGIYDRNVWQMYEDLCELDIVAMHACLRSVQLGLVSPDNMLAVVENKKSVDVKDVVLKIRQALPSFAKDIPSVFDEVAPSWTFGPKGFSDGPT